MTTTHAKTLHRVDCTRVYARLDATCPRCQELAAGATARRGWTSRRTQLDRQHAENCRTHNCATAKCGPVCAFGEW